MAIADNLIANESIEFQSEKHWMAPIRASGVAVLAFDRLRADPRDLAVR